LRATSGYVISAGLSSSPYTATVTEPHLVLTRCSWGRKKSTHFLAAISAALSTPSKKIRTTWKWNKVWQILDDSDNRWTCGPNIGSDFKKTH